MNRSFFAQSGTMFLGPETYTSTDAGLPRLFVGDGSFAAANTDPRTYDTLGRRYFLRVTARL